MPPVLQPLPDLIVANGALNDRAALDRLWQDNGYLFFRGVLDTAAIASARQRVLSILADMGVVDGAENRWNGADLRAFPDKVEAVYQAGIWRDIASHPQICGFLQSVMGGPIRFIPLAGYRTTAPGAGDPADPFASRHQDGFMNGDMPFRTCWIPLDTITPDMGGFALAEGQHKQGYAHDLANPPRFPIPAGAVPRSSWRSATFQPGDAIIFDRHVPHGGLPNRSDRFRLSLDIRFMRADDPAFPIVGTIITCAPDRALVRVSDAEIEVRLDADTYLRANSGARLDPAAAGSVFAPGAEVMIAHRDGTATMMKPVEG